MFNETELRNKVIEVAKTLLGKPYSKMDCNEFVRAVARTFGVELGDPSSGNAKDLYNKGLAKKVDESLSVSAIASMLNKGDLVFWASKNHPERWMNIHHVSIYDEDGYNYESSSGEGKVVRRKLWENSEWQIVLIADITAILNNLPVQPAETEDDEMLVYFFQHAARAAGYKILKDGAVWKDAVTGENNGCDNSRGPWTQDVIKQVQKKHGLNQTGKIDGKTIYAVMSEVGNSGALESAQAEIKDLWNRVNNYAAGVRAAANMKI